MGSPDPIGINLSFSNIWWRWVMPFCFHLGN